MTDDPMVYCPACGSPFTEVLGVLGHRVHYRCRECGMDSSNELPKQDQSHTQEVV